MPRVVRHEWQDTSWMALARCLGMDVGIFFIDLRGGRKGTLRYLVDLCAGCPVRTQCAMFGLQNSDSAFGDYGWFGGLAPVDRQRIRKWARELDVPITEMAPFFTDLWQENEKRSRRPGRAHVRANQPPARSIPKEERPED